MELISLQRLSTICIAARIWETPCIQNQVTNLYRAREVMKFKLKNPCTRFPGMGFPWKRWNGDGDHFKLIISSAVELSNLLGLPLKLKKKCESVIQELGEKILDWMYYVVEILHFNFKFAQKICWKSDGTINESQIFKFWEVDEEFAKQEHLELEALHILACVTANEDFITKNQFEMEEALKKEISDFKLSNHENKIYTLLALFLHLHYQKKQEEQALDFFWHNGTKIKVVSNDLYRILPFDKILRMCATAGFTESFYYIWNICSLKSEEFLFDTAQTCLYCVEGFTTDLYTANCAKGLNSVTNYHHDKSIELLLFLINQMTEEQKVKFYQECAKTLFIRIALVFPDHKIISQLLNNYFSNISKSDYQRIILLILNRLNNRNLKTKQFRELFQKLFTRIPNNFKEDIFRNNNIFPLLRNIHCFKIVINSMGENFRIEAIRRIQGTHIGHYSVENITEGNFQYLERFMNEILKTDDERKSYKEYILKFIDIIICSVESLRVIDKILDIFSETIEERALLKNKIKLSYVCNEFLRNWRYDKTEKFLEWMFNSKEEVGNYRNSFHRLDYILEKSYAAFDKQESCLFKNFKGNRKDLLNFFFGLPEEKESMENKEIYINFRYTLEINPIEKSSLLQISVEESLLVVKLFELRIFFYFYECFSLSDIANLFMNWSCSDEKRKSAIKKMYFNNERERNFFIKLVILLSVPISSYKFEMNW